MAVVELRKCLIILMILYVLAFFGAMLAAISMIMHVYPQSECLLFSTSGQGGKLFYGNYASCNIVAYVFLAVIVGAAYLFVLCWLELRKMKGHHPQGPYVPERVPKHIMLVHLFVIVITLALTLVVTGGYVSACNSLHDSVSRNVQEKLNVDPHLTRGEEIQTRYEDDYKFHRYTNRYGNAFGNEFYTIRITCRSILTDPEVHQKLHDSHYEQQSRYYGYWYGTDLFAYDSQSEATRTNALVEASMAGAWLSFVFWLGGLVLILLQRYFIHKVKMEQDRVSMHSTMMGGAGSVFHEGSFAGSQFKGQGSIISGRGSSFQRGGSRGSDRSIRASRRDIDDLALSNILTPGMNATTPNSNRRFNSNPPVFVNQGINFNQPSHHSSRETGYISDGANSQTFHYPSQQQQQHQPFIQGQEGVFRKTADATYLSRDEVETEIF